MSGGGSVRALLLRVLILTAVLLALSRWRGRGVRPGAEGRAGAIRTDAAVEDSGTEQMSAPGDLTFYKTLGSGGQPAGAGFAAEAAGTPPSAAPHSNKDTARTPPGQPAPGSPAFVVQVLATRDAGVARRMRDRLAARGFPAVVLQDRSGRQVVYRVRAGRYQMREEADAAARVLRRIRLRPWVLQEGL